MHAIRENQSLAMHRRIAALLVAQPDRVLGKALENLRRWTEGKETNGVPPVYTEWRNILLERTPVEIAALLVSNEEDAVRLRQSSPFAGVLNAREVWQIKKNHEAA